VGVDAERGDADGSARGDEVGFARWGDKVRWRRGELGV